MKAWLFFALLAGLAACSSPPTDLGTPLLELRPDIVDFKAVVVDQTKLLAAGIANRGDGTLHVRSISIAGGDAASFSVTSALFFDLKPGDSDHIQILFSPKAPRPHSALLIASTNAGSDTLLLRGSGRDQNAGNDVVVATLVATPPLLDGDASEAVWGLATPTRLTFSQVESQIDPFSSESRRSPFNGEMRALYTADSLYLLVRYADPDADSATAQWRLNGADPALSSNWGREAQLQDGVSFIFPVSGVVEGHQAGETFALNGCAATCHQTASLDNYEGGHYPARGTADIWYWQAALTNPAGLAGNQASYGAGTGGNANIRLPDDKIPIAQPNLSDDPPLPVAVPEGNNGGLGPTRLWLPLASLFSPNEPNPATGLPWSIGDRIPAWGLLDGGATGARIRARGGHRNGEWVVEFAAPMMAGGSGDVGFNINTPVYFGLAVHDRQRKFTREEYRLLPSPPRPSHYGVPLMQLIFN